jgi:hypothetical protein
MLGLYFGVPALVPRLGSLVYSGGTPATGKIVSVGADHHLLLTFGGWLQGTGALLCVVFLLALAQWSGGGSSLPSRILLLGCAVLVGVVLAEMVFTFTWASAAADRQSSSARAAYDLMAHFAQVFAIVPAPLCTLPSQRCSPPAAKYCRRSLPAWPLLLASASSSRAGGGTYPKCSRSRRRPVRSTRPVDPRCRHRCPLLAALTRAARE